MKHGLPIALLVALAAPLPLTAAAQTQAGATPDYSLSANLGFASTYRYRGIDQTNGNPALQGGVDLSTARGYYAGAWGSNVNWLSDAGGGTISNSLEIDLYGGYRRQMGDFGYDAGLLAYYYPGTYPAGMTKPHTAEVYLAGSWKMLTLKYSHAITDIFGVPDSRGAGYLDAGASMELAGGYTLKGHIGYQLIPASAANERSKSDCSYADWSLGVSKEFSGLNVGLSYIDTDAKGGAGECYRNAFNKNLGRQTLVLSVGKTF